MTTQHPNLNPNPYQHLDLGRKIDWMTSDRAVTLAEAALKYSCDEESIECPECGDMVSADLTTITDHLTKTCAVAAR